MAETDEEQIEAIKRWWDENGTSLIVGAVLAVGGVFGYQAWDNHVRETGEAASKIYNDMLEALVLDSPFDTLDEERVSTGRFLAGQLKEDYADSAYADYAALYLASIAVQQEDLPAAEAELQGAIDGGVDESLAPIFHIRLARVQMVLGKHDEALQTLLAVEEPGEHTPSYEEARGDIYYAMDNPASARESYQAALDALENPASRPILRMKLDDLVDPEVVVPVDPAEPLASTESDPTETED